MDFNILAELFEKLENTSKRLEKIMILRDFIVNLNKKEFIILDVISGNFQREINKKKLGISLKTCFSVLSFVSKREENEIESEFNKIGDVGVLAKKMISSSKQSSLFESESSNLSFETVVLAFREIGNISGNNSNKKKKEILSKLFLLAKTEFEYKFLARFLIDDLRIGVSFGVLKEACVQAFFPKILGIDNYCDKCDYFSINVNSCFNCKSKIDLNLQENLLEKKYKIIEISTPKKVIGLNNFIGDIEEEEKVKFLLRLDRKTQVIKAENPREIYNLFLGLFEKKYNLLNNFELILSQVNENLLSVLDTNIILFRPIKSMLGTRVSNIDEAFEISDKPAFVDFKYDGLRVQIHNNYGEVKLFSRNLDDITKQFPEVCDYIKDNFSDFSFVVDSECVAYDFQTQKFLDFQVLSRRILTKNIDDVSNIHVVVRFFDIMHYNGETILNKEYSFRRKLVDKLLLGRNLRQKLFFDTKLLNRFKHNFDY